MTEPIRRTVRVACSVDRAFALFTTQIDHWWPPGHRRFPGSTLVLEARNGGRFYEMGIGGQEVFLGEVIRCAPPHSIAYTWYPGALTGPTLVEITFSTDGSGTLVQVVHSEGTAQMGEAWPEKAAIFTRAWSQVLPAYADYADGQ